METWKGLLGGNSSHMTGKIRGPYEHSRPTVKVQELEMPGTGSPEAEKPVKPPREAAFY
jgi:hypothetical protein